MTVCKDTKGKYRPSLVPMRIIKCIAMVREYGTKKYGGDENNWKKVPSQDYRDAMMRHMIAYIEDPHAKDESGLPHLYHIACNCAFLCSREHFGDD